MSLPSSVTAAPRVRIGGAAAAAGSGIAAHIGLDDLCGPLFKRSSSGSAATPAAATAAAAAAAILDLQGARAIDARLQVCQEVDAGLAQLARDLHESRLREMRKLARELAEDDWRFARCDTLIGGNPL